VIVLIIGVVAWYACAAGHAADGRRVVVLGFDGLDYGLTRELMARGRLPHFSQLAARGSFAPLGTTIPPQSPVAWSSFITGLDPGGHGIFDFIHRDPRSMAPYLSTTRTDPPSHFLRIGKWQLPLVGGHVELLRQGEPFWQRLTDAGMDTTIVRMPANFPPSGSATRELSGMGTPDLLGTYGTFSYYTSEPLPPGAVSGGVVYPVDVENGVVRASLEGPEDPFLRERQTVRADFAAYIDSSRKYVKLVAGDQERVLGVGEWSDWVAIEFKLAPAGRLRAECRFYLKELDPDFALYVTPLNLDPVAPELPISTPPAYASDLARATGRFYSQGMPEDTKAYKSGVFTPAEFLVQARIAGSENERQFQYVLDHFRQGLLFYYFGNVDQVSHMMWRPMDPGHPAYDEARDAPYRSVVENLYIEMDGIVGETLARLHPEDLLVVMSDHGFASWRRAFQLNGWLRDNGYLALRAPGAPLEGYFDQIDWSKTRAYGLGLNGLYVNLKGRERFGIVDARDRAALLDEIRSKLLAFIDPQTHQPAVTKVFRREQVYTIAGHEDVAPDLVVGYAKGTRTSDESALGTVPPGPIVADNRGAWSGDHCMDPDTVPGILLTSRALATRAPTLQALGAAILAELGVHGFPARGTKE
jgi:predicted AlkP superfamily phosphohydrolase/phosphomutase